MGRPLIGKRASCFLPEETHSWLDVLKRKLGINTKAEMIRVLIEHCHSMKGIELVLKLERGIIDEEEFAERVKQCE